jgi:hypothetical protein
MSTGRLRKGSDGDAVLVLTKDREAGRRRLTVINSEGKRLGALVSLWPGWSIRDALGRPIAEIRRKSRREDHALYVAQMHGLDTCRYTWSTAFWTRPVLEVCFEEGSQIDRALAMAVAPYLEAAAYSRNRWTIRA